jgi:hypothetical protein
VSAVTQLAQPNRLSCPKHRTARSSPGTVDICALHAHALSLTVSGGFSSRTRSTRQSGSAPVRSRARRRPRCSSPGRTSWRRRRLLWRGDRCSASDGRGPRRRPNCSRNRPSRRRRSFGLRPRDKARGPPLRSRRQLCVADGGPPAPPVHLNNGTAGSNGEYGLSLVARRKDTGSHATGSDFGRIARKFAPVKFDPQCVIGTCI